MENKQINKKEPWEDRHEIVSSLVNKNSIKTAIELGVAFGGNSENLLSNTKIEKLHGVDAYKNHWTYNDGMNRKQSELDSIYHDTIERLKKFGSRYKHIRKFSKNAIKDVPDNIDFLYVDADHSYIGCLNDLRLWTPKVKDGGIIAGDDYNSKLFPDVAKAVHNYFGKLGWKIHTEEPCVWWTKKESFKQNISFIDQLFLFSPVVRIFHFFLGEFYNATLGKLSYKTKSIRRKTRTTFRKIVKAVLPNFLVAYLKRIYGKN